MTANERLELLLAGPQLKHAEARLHLYRDDAQEKLESAPKKTIELRREVAYHQGVLDGFYQCKRRCKEMLASMMIHMEDFLEDEGFNEIDKLKRRKRKEKP